MWQTHLYFNRKVGNAVGKLTVEKKTLVSMYVSFPHSHFYPLFSLLIEQTKLQQLGLTRMQCAVTFSGTNPTEQ